MDSCRRSRIGQRVVATQDTRRAHVFCRFGIVGQQFPGRVLNSVKSGCEVGGSPAPTGLLESTLSSTFLVASIQRFSQQVIDQDSRDKLRLLPTVGNSPHSQKCRLRSPCPKKDSTARMMKTTKSILAPSQERAATPPKPRKAAISAMTRNAIASRNMISSPSQRRAPLAHRSRGP